MAAYYGIITKDTDSDYSVMFPDVPGCYSAGSTLEELEVMARDALGGHIEVLRDEGMEVNPPASYDAITALAKDVEGFIGITLIAVPDKIPSVRVNINVGQQDLELIDTAAAKRGMTRSGFLVRAGKLVASGSCEL